MTQDETRGGLAVVLAAVLAFAGAALLPFKAAGEPIPPETVISAWQKPAAHPLVGRIWRASTGEVVDGFALAAAPRAATPLARALGLDGRAFVLLGEVHDNAEHHLLRAGLLDDLTQRSPWGRGTHPPVVSEHIRADQAQGLAQFRDLLATRSVRPGVDDLFAALQWEKTGWTPAAIFKPLYAALLDARLPLRIGDPPRNSIRDIARGGLDKFDPSERARLKLDVALPATLAQALGTELEGSHCGMLPTTAVPGMSAAQRYRDAYLADALIDAEHTLGPAILLAGNGHVRTDRGVPWYLRQRVPGKTMTAVMLIEVEDGNTDLLTYVPRDPGGKPAVDVIVFTPRAIRDDPCREMRAREGKKS